MPLETAVVLFAIAFAFAIFAVTLAWSDIRTRHLPEK